MTPAQINFAVTVSSRFQETHDESKNCFDSLRTLVSRKNNGLITPEQEAILKNAIEVLSAIHDRTTSRSAEAYITTHQND